MADMHTPLLPCPFCGGEAEFSQTGRNELTLRCVGKQPSGLRGCGPMYRQRVLPNRHTLDWLRGIMAETWNRRAPSQDAETIKALREALTEAAGTLEGLSYIHDSNPSDALADMAPVEYARHMLFEARQMARAAHAEARAALAGSAS